jgi:hypothetical protein
MIPAFADEICCMAGRALVLHPWVIGTTISVRCRTQQYAALL